MVSVSIVIPAHNEEKNIPPLIKSISSIFSKSKYRYEIIIVNDNSTDNTGRIAEQFASSLKQVRVVHRKNSPGFGKALKDGFNAAKNDVIVPMMGDACDDPNNALKMVKELEKGSFDFVVGTRFSKGGFVKGMSGLKFLASNSFTYFSQLLGLKMTDTSNAFKVYKKEVLQAVNPKSDGFEILAEIPITAHYLGFKYTEIPVRWAQIKKSKETSILKRGPKYIITALKIAAKFKFRKKDRNKNFTKSL